MSTHITGASAAECECPGCRESVETFRPNPLERYYSDPEGLALVQAILDRKAGKGA